MKKTLLITCFMIVCLSGYLFSEVPGKISFQGIITKSSGTPFDGSEDLLFKIYDAQTGGNLLWTETQNVQVDDGTFSVILGSVKEIDIDWNGNFWLGFSVVGESELPRVQLVSVPFSMKSKSLELPYSGTGDDYGATFSIQKGAAYGSSYAIRGKSELTQGQLGGYYGVYAETQSDFRPAVHADNIYNGIYTQLSGIYGLYTSYPSKSYLSAGAQDYGLSTTNLVNNVTAILAGEEAVKGENSNGNFGKIANNSYGVYGEHYDGNYGYLGGSGRGVYGEVSVGNEHGVYGKHTGNNNFGYLGGTWYAVYGKGDIGHYGYIGGSSNAVYGRAVNSEGKAVYGINSVSSNYAYLGADEYSVYAETGNANHEAVYGKNTSANTNGLLAGNGSGAFGENTEKLTTGALGSIYAGVYGTSNDELLSAIEGNNLDAGTSGWLGSSICGVEGLHSSNNNGMLGRNDCGAWGYNNSSGAIGRLGTANAAVDGIREGNEGFLAGSDFGVKGENSNGNYGLLGDDDYGVVALHNNGNYAYLAGSFYAGFFNNNVRIDGELMVGTTQSNYRLNLPNNSTNSLGRAIAYSWNTYSDNRLKSNQTELNYGLAEILALNPKRYEHHSSSNDNNKIEILPESENTIGLIAQEVYEVIPEAIQKPENEDNEYWTMDYDKLIPVLVKAMQEQNDLIKKQQKEIEELKKTVESLR